VFGYRRPSGPRRITEAEFWQLDTRLLTDDDAPTVQSVHKAPPASRDRQHSATNVTALSLVPATSSRATVTSLAATLNRFYPVRPRAAVPGAIGRHHPVSADKRYTEHQSKLRSVLNASNCRARTLFPLLFLPISVTWITCVELQSVLNAAPHLSRPARRTSLDESSFAIARQSVRRYDDPIATRGRWHGGCRHRGPA
jgi:hypothetical protein